MLRNPKGATSLRWLEVLLDGGIEVHGQLVICPGVNDGDALEDTLAGILDRYPDAGQRGRRAAGLEPLLQRARRCASTRTPRRCASWRPSRSGRASTGGSLGRRLVFAADEYYLLAGRDVPPARHYEGYPQHENGIGMSRAFAEAFGRPGSSAPGGVRHGFFASVDAAPAEGYRALRLPSAPAGRDERPVTVLTGTYGASVLAPLVASHPRDDMAVRAITNDFFGGNIGVAGLLTGEDVARALEALGSDGASSTAAGRTTCAGCCPTPASTRDASSTA